MNTAAVIAIAIGVVLVLAAISFFTLARRSDVRGAGALSGETLNRDRASRKDSRAYEAEATSSRTAAVAEAEGTASRGTGTALATVDEEPAIVPWVEPDPEVIGVSRRQFFNRATVTLMSAGLGAFAAAAFVGFLWPTGTGGFGGQVPAGKLAAIKDGIQAGGGFYYVPEARSWITEYPSDALPIARTVYPANLLTAMEEGIVVLSQKCPHLGCRVPECPTSQWFECQCHGSQYNRVGEKKGGPAPRGMDRHPADISASGDVVINTGVVVPGPAIGTNTTGQEAEGPHCTGGGDH
ncbi:QcrA and Rieske domain-containing protein [Ilumatobacter nonamiensis]|uniref:QcrA and Rieske domain-containing protein n=1 Tax=Ilumatobacter nonamiensis TaxID=467093 RepID=UPI0003460E6D|nr:Rieske 2Fe-2S domain-containing protein [Ilumatobacter nonamiensis]